MKTKLYVATALLLAGAAAPSSAAVYNVTRSIGTGSVSGTITTDNTLGVLASTNVTAYALTLTDAQGSRTITQNGTSASTTVFGNAFSATSAGLFFDFNQAGQSGVYLANLGPQAFYCVQTNGCFDYNGAGEAVTTNYAGGNRTVLRESGLVQLASAATGAVPEPATWAMMTLGFGAVGFAMRRKMAATRIRFA